MRQSPWGEESLRISKWILLILLIAHKARNDLNRDFWSLRFNRRRLGLFWLITVEKPEDSVERKQTSVSVSDVSRINALQSWI